MAVDIVHAFPAPGAIGPKASVIEASDGNFYGVTEHGGPDDCGTIFRMTPSGGVTVIHAFDCADGKGPFLPLVQASDGLLYGTAPANTAIAFRTTLDGAFEVIHVFDREYPSTALVEGSDGNLYGGTRGGVLSGIFRMSTSGDLVKLLDISTGGVSVLSSDSGGGMFGAMTDFAITPSFFVRGTATLFQLSVDGTITPLYSVSVDLCPICAPAEQTTGFTVAALVVTPTALYGVDTRAAGGGTSFRVDANGLTVLHDFRSSPAGAEPIGLSSGPDGHFYGVTRRASNSGSAAVFQMTVDGAVAPVHTFDPATDGGDAAGSLVPMTDGRLAGLTEETGERVATAFALSTSGDFSVLHRFADPDGSAPNYLIQSGDGKLYGTTGLGGAQHAGVLFRLPGNGSADVLHDFSFSNRTALAPYLPGGADRAPTLMEAADGNFYGTTFGSGSNHGGTLFRATRTGEHVDLVNFLSSVNGSQPLAPPIQANDGALYGTTVFHGAFLGYTGGSVYKFTPGGDLATVHVFDQFNEGDLIGAALIEATDGRLYGTAATGGQGNSGNPGTVFSMTTDGSSVTALHSFSGPDGAHPVAPLIQASDGNFYGTTFAGGPADLGTVFRLTPSGTFTQLHVFNGADGANPSAALLQASDGNLYGVTQGGGAHGLGAVFRLTLGGAFQVMHSFDGADGERPSRRLIQGTDGYLYGTAERGGPDGGGVVFRLIDVSCEDTLTLSYTGSTLNLGFHIRSAVPSLWTNWLVTTGAVFPLWFLPIPPVSPAVDFNVPIPQFPHLGYVGVLTILANPQVQAVCGDWKIVNTGTP